MRVGSRPRLFGCLRSRPELMCGPNQETGQDDEGEISQHRNCTAHLVTPGDRAGRPAHFPGREHKSSHSRPRRCGFREAFAFGTGRKISLSWEESPERRRVLAKHSFSAASDLLCSNQQNSNSTGSTARVPVNGRQRLVNRWNSRSRNQFSGTPVSYCWEALKL
jgi:hypothetical protein